MYKCLKDKVTIFSPATIANVGPGFDILGFAIEQPGDLLSAEPVRGKHHEINNLTEAKLPADPEKNAATVALAGFLDHIQYKGKFRITFHQKILPGSGIGSSAASSAGAVFAVNHLLGEPLSRRELVPFAMLGEEAASGSAHADNVAPALLGGFVLIRSYNPLELVSIPSPEDLWCAVVHPEIQLATQDSRRILKGNLPLNAAIEQCGNLGGLITGLFTSNYQLIGRSLHDSIAEPARSFLIPGYDRIKAASAEAGALGSSISGSGPSIFSLCKTQKIAEKVANAKKIAAEETGIPVDVFVSAINMKGTRVTVL